MGVNIYWYIVAAVIFFGMILPQEGKKRKQYIVLMTAIHAFVAGWKYIYLTGDLRKYAAYYGKFVGKYVWEEVDLGWFDEAVFNGGKNFLFFWLNKFISELSNGDFHVFLVVIAVITQVLVGVIIYRYSPKPWLSFLVWDCMAFYITYYFSAIKQGLAMSILMLAYIGIVERKPKKFLGFALLAGCIHAPAFCFLPAYFFATRKINEQSIIAYFLVALSAFIFRDSIVGMFSDAYYDMEEFEATQDVALGGRFFVILLIVVTGIILKGLFDSRFEGLFNLMIVAALLQMFSVYDNVFTRLTDYYLQFSILYIPMIFYEGEKSEDTRRKGAYKPVICLDRESRKILATVLVVVLIWWYYITCLGATIEIKGDDYLNYRFNWEVVEDEQV